MSTLRDALVAALSLDTFNRHAEKVDMANVAQLINNLHSLFLADGDRFVATPNFHVYTMYRPHQGGKAVRIAVEAPDVAFKAGGREQKIFRVAGSASLARSEGRDPDPGSHPCDRAGRGGDSPAGGGSARGPADGPHPRAVNAHNTFRCPEHPGAQARRDRPEGVGRGDPLRAAAEVG